MKRGTVDVRRELPDGGYVILSCRYRPDERREDVYEITLSLECNGLVLNSCPGASWFLSEKEYRQIFSAIKSRDGYRIAYSFLEKIAKDRRRIEPELVLGLIADEV